MISNSLFGLVIVIGDRMFLGCKILILSKSNHFCPNPIKFAQNIFARVCGCIPSSYIWNWVLSISAFQNLLHHCALVAEWLTFNMLELNSALPVTAKALSHPAHKTSCHHTPLQHLRKELCCYGIMSKVQAFRSIWVCVWIWIKKYMNKAGGLLLSIIIYS